MLEMCFMENKYHKCFFFPSTAIFLPARWGQGGEEEQTNLYFNFPATDLQFLLCGQYFLQTELFTPPAVFSHTDPVTPPDFKKMRNRERNITLGSKKLSNASSSSFPKEGGYKEPHEERRREPRPA